MRRLFTLIALMGTVLALLGLSDAPAGAAPETSLSGVAQVSAGGSHTCARLATGRVRCWGENTSGELGNGSQLPSPGTTEVVNHAGTGPLTGVTQVSAGYHHSCARLRSGRAMCWGDNPHGGLGDGSVHLRGRPTLVVTASGAPLTGVRLVVASSGYFSCAVLTSGQVRCWGDNDNGQLGDGTVVERHRAVVVRSVAGPGALTGVTQLDLGVNHSCARLTDGQARCWGDDENGQLGNGGNADRHRPVVVRTPTGQTGPLTGVVTLGLGDKHSCARLANHQLRCWGANGNGQLGIGSTSPSNRPVVVSNLNANGPLLGVVDVGGGESHTCVHLRSSQARCWGNDGSGQVGVGGIGGNYLFASIVDNIPNTGPQSGITQITTGDAHTCARQSDGELLCWGDNNAGQLGIGGGDSGSPVPVQV